MGYEFSSEAAAEAAQEKGLSIEQLAPGSGSGGNVTKSDVESYSGDPELAPGAPAVAAAVADTDRAPGTGVPGPLDMQLGGDAPVDPSIDLEGAKASSLRERDHREGCPEIGSSDRVEASELTKPPVKAADGSVLEPAKRVKVTRCVECGGQRVEDAS